MRKRMNQRWLPLVVEIFEKSGVERTAGVNWSLIVVVRGLVKDQSHTLKPQRTCRRQRIHPTTWQIWSAIKQRARRQKHAEIGSLAEF